jgi:hypothetical protein
MEESARLLQSQKNVSLYVSPAVSDDLPIARTESVEPWGGTPGIRKTWLKPPAPSSPSLIDRSKTKSCSYPSLEKRVEDESLNGLMEVSAAKRFLNFPSASESSHASGAAFFDFKKWNLANTFKGTDLNVSLWLSHLFFRDAGFADRSDHKPFPINFLRSHTPVIPVLLSSRFPLHG